jgi:hypothetical protein
MARNASNFMSGLSGRNYALSFDFQLTLLEALRAKFLWQAHPTPSSMSGSVNE